MARRNEKLMPLHQNICAALRQRIISGNLMPGARLIEQELATEFEVSRATLRDAFKALAFEGLLHIEPNRGATVNSISENELRELFDIRMMFEVHAVRSVALKSDNKLIKILRQQIKEMRTAVNDGNHDVYFDVAVHFHQQIMAGCSNTLLLTLYEQVKPRFQRYQSLLAWLPESPSQSIEEHSKIVKAIADGDPDAAEKEIQRHLERLIARFDTANKSIVVGRG